MEVVCTSETSVYFKETKQLYIPEGYHLHTRRRDNMKSHVLGRKYTINSPFMGGIIATSQLTQILLEIILSASRSSYF
jgi:hypothetical protein